MSILSPAATRQMPLQRINQRFLSAIHLNRQHTRSKKLPFPAFRQQPLQFRLREIAPLAKF